MFKVKLLNKNAKLPVKALKGDLGYDLFLSRNLFLSDRNSLIKPSCTDCDIITGFGKIPIGIAIELPDGIGAFIKSKSGLFSTKGILVEGVIDRYRGEIHVMLANLSNKEYFFKKGSKIAQLVPVVETHLGEPYTVDELTPSIRGNGGFGHTGI